MTSRTPATSSGKAPNSQPPASDPTAGPAQIGWPAFTTGDWRGTHRLIPATFVDRTEPFLAGLVGDGSDDRDGDIAALTELSAATNTRLQVQAGLDGLDIGSHELVYDLDNSKFINGAFTYPGQGARFSDDSRGAWYAGLEVATSLAEVAHHRALQLAEINVWEDVTEYQDLTCDIGGPHFADLRDTDPRTAACLDHSSYLASQALAPQLLTNKAAGVVWPSVRHPGGTCVVCFRPSLLPPVARGGRWRLHWDGNPEPEITELADVDER